MNDSPGWIACCDIGGTKARLGFVDRAGTVIGDARFLVSAFRQPKDFATALKEHWLDLADKHGIPQDQIRGVGCSITGPLDSQRELVLTSYNLGNWINVPFRALLEEVMQLPAWMEVDSLSAALGEAWIGAGAGVKDLLYLVVGTGIGSGILMGGLPQRGWRGMAGEIGHISIQPDGPPCACGNIGCLEVLASGPAIALRAQAFAAARTSSELSKIASERALSAVDVVQAARRCDAAALQVVEDTAGFLGLGLANAITFLDPEVVILGGGVMFGGGDVFLEPLRRAIAGHIPEWIDLNKTRIELAALAEESALVGVAQLVWENLSKENG